MAAGNKSSSSLVHPVSFFSPRDSFLISRVWSCMCTWHLLADVTPPLSVSAHNAHPTRTKAEAKCRGFTITVSFVLPGGLRLFPSRPVCRCNWFLFSCTNEFLISLEVIYMEMAWCCDYAGWVILTSLWSRHLAGKLPLLPFTVRLILSAKINWCPF